MSKCKAEHKVMNLPNYTKTLQNSSRANPETHHTRFAGKFKLSSAAPSFQSETCEYGE